MTHVKRSNTTLVEHGKTNVRLFVTRTRSEQTKPRATSLGDYRSKRLIKEIADRGGHHHKGGLAGKTRQSQRADRAKTSANQATNAITQGAQNQRGYHPRGND